VFSLTSVPSNCSGTPNTNPPPPHKTPTPPTPPLNPPSPPPLPRVPYFFCALRHAGHLSVENLSSRVSPTPPILGCWTFLLVKYTGVYSALVNFVCDLRSLQLFSTRFLPIRDPCLVPIFCSSTEEQRVKTDCLSWPSFTVNYFRKLLPSFWVNGTPQSMVSVTTLEIRRLFSVFPCATPTHS